MVLILLMINGAIMKKYRVLVVFISLVLFLTACTPKNPLLGNWESENGDLFKFYKDGTLVVESDYINFSGTYEIIDDSSVKITFEGLLSLAGSSVADYKVSGKTLTLTMSGENFVLSKTD